MHTGWWCQVSGKLRPITIRWWPGNWERIKAYARDTRQTASRAANELVDEGLREKGYPPIRAGQDGRG